VHVGPDDDPQPASGVKGPRHDGARIGPSRPSRTRPQASICRISSGSTTPVSFLSSPPYG
jgi:hypothetical protein